MEIKRSYVIGLLICIIIVGVALTIGTYIGIAIGINPLGGESFAIITNIIGLIIIIEILVIRPLEFLIKTLRKKENPK